MKKKINKIITDDDRAINNLNELHKRIIINGKFDISKTRFIEPEDILPLSFLMIVFGIVLFFIIRIIG